MKFSPKETPLVFIGDNQGWIRVIDIEQEAVISVFNLKTKQSIIDMEFDPSGDALLIGLEDGSIHMLSYKHYYFAYVNEIETSKPSNLLY